MSALVRSLGQRVPWEVAQRIFAGLGLRPGNGWQRTFGKLERNQIDIAGRDEDLSRSLKEHILSGEKSVWFYELDQQDIARLRNALLAAQLSTNAAAELFPVLLSEDQIEGEEVGTPELIATVPNDAGLAGVFSCIRQVEFRDTVEPAGLPEEVTQAIGEFTELIRVRRRKVQALDIVWVPHQGSFVDLRVDLPTGVTAEAAALYHERLRRTVNELLGSNRLGTPVKLFPVIDAIYRNPSEGTVVELAFTTTTASVKHEKMRRRSSCLRHEIYHQAGKEALNGEIEPYKLAVQWSLSRGENVTSRPELNLMGRTSMLAARAQVLNSAEVRQCIDIADFEYVRDRVTAYL